MRLFNDEGWHLTIVRARTNKVATTIVMIAMYPGSGGTGWGSGLLTVMSLAEIL